MRKLLNEFRCWKWRIKQWFGYWKVCKRLCGFDWIDVIEVERHQLLTLQHCLKKTISNEDLIRKIDLALRLLDIITDRTLEPDRHRIGLRYINIKNRKRFGIQEWNGAPDVLRYYLYEQKVWHLYHKIREQYMRSWWD